MPELLFATHNRHKAEEIRFLLDADWAIRTLEDVGWTAEIPEPHDTLEANAREKSHTLFKALGIDCFSEDTGLEVEALAGEPGVRSARYAGEPVSHERNIDKLLSRLQGITHRQARFRTIISLFWQGREYQFEGICPGKITEERLGTQGFGYDPVFIPDGDTRSFAEMDLADKSRYSHRRKALDQLVRFLRDKDYLSAEKK